MNQMELNTHETIQYFLPRLAVALENLVKEKKRANDLKEKELKCLTKK